MALDLTRFGFTPTESLVYEVLLRGGPGTGYAIARAAGLARANAYSALEGLVHKGAARSEEGRPKRYRPEPPSTLIARIIDRQGQALDELSTVLDALAVPSTPTIVELTSARGALQLMAREIARAETRVELIAPPDAYPPLVPALRKTSGAGVAMSLGSSSALDLGFAHVDAVTTLERWPDEPVLMVIDDRGAILASRRGEAVDGHWATGATFIAAVSILIQSFYRAS